jgi:excisionase family DNA binding protein
MALISTKDAAQRLKLSVRRVQELVKGGRIPAQLIGGVYLIDHRDLALVKNRKTGRPAGKAKKR